MENKRYKVYITVFVITTIIASCIAVYFAIDSNNKDTENITVGEVENVATDEVEKQETNVEVKEVEKIVEVEKGVYPQVDVNKCLNKEEGVVYQDFLLRQFDRLDIYCSRNDDKRSIILSCEPNLLKEYYNVDKGTAYVNINIGGFSNEIVDILGCSLGGHVVGGEVILTLMKDGTVEYVPLLKALQSNNMKSYGKVSGVSDIVRLDTMSFTNKDGIGGATGSIAIKSDGSFYNLMPILRDEVY